MGSERQSTAYISPIGSTVQESIEEALRGSAEYRAEYERVAPFMAVANQIILRRGQLGLTQKELAERVGTSHSAISRLERGQHNSSLDTIRRVADALESRLVVGFETVPANEPGRKLATG